MHSVALTDTGVWHGSILCFLLVFFFCTIIYFVFRMVFLGLLYVWGKNASGQLGTGNTESLDAPTVVPFFADRKVSKHASLSLSLCDR